MNASGRRNQVDGESRQEKKKSYGFEGWDDGAVPSQVKPQLNIATTGD